DVAHTASEQHCQADRHPDSDQQQEHGKADNCGRRAAHRRPLTSCSAVARAAMASSSAMTDVAAIAQPMGMPDTIVVVLFAMVSDAPTQSRQARKIAVRP